MGGGVDRKRRKRKKRKEESMGEERGEVQDDSKSIGRGYFTAQFNTNEQHLFRQI